MLRAATGMGLVICLLSPAVGIAADNDLHRCRGTHAAGYRASDVRVRSISCHAGRYVIRKYFRAGLVTSDTVHAAGRRWECFSDGRNSGFCLSFSHSPRGDAGIYFDPARR
jgi:hypothetical protein